jgi:hypothetical protein
VQASGGPSFSVAKPNTARKQQRETGERDRALELRHAEFRAISTSSGVSTAIPAQMMDA